MPQQFWKNFLILSQSTISVGELNENSSDSDIETDTVSRIDVGQFFVNSNSD